MYYPPVEDSLWRQALSQLKKINSEKIVYALLFLLPIFAVTVRHWVSNIFTLLTVLSLVLLYLQRKQRTELLREEKILLWGFAVYFGIFLLTSVVNGWGELQTRYAGGEIRFLLFIPLYLVIRQMSEASKWLLFGMIFGVIFTAYDAAGELWSGHVEEYDGIYSPLFTGPIILLIAFLAIPYFFEKTENLWLRLTLLFVAGLAIFVVSATGARNAYVATIVLGLLFILYQYNGAKRYALLFAVFAFAYAIYISMDTVNHRVNMAIAEYKEYISFENPAESRRPLSSVGTRLEMWRVTPIFFKDNPIFGIGRGNYTAEVKKYTQQRLVHQDIAEHGHPHNVYSEALISKGLLGLLSILWITVYPLIVLIGGYRNHMKSAYYGITLIVGYMAFSLTDASTFIKGNYIAMYIVLLAVLFSYHMREKRQQQSTSG